MIGGALLILSSVLMQPNLPSAGQGLVPQALIPGSVTVPFTSDRQHLFVTLTVNGTPGMQFLLDSGTTTNILDLHTSQALGLKPEGIQREKDIGLGGGMVAVAEDKDVAVTMDQLPVAHILALVDLHDLQLAYHHRIDGILGFPLLQQYVVVLDFQKQMLTLLPAKGYRYHGDGSVVSLARKKHSVEIPITLSTDTRTRMPAIVDVDTGSDVSLMLFQAFAQKKNLQDMFVSSHGLWAYGLGGYFPVKIGRMPAISMGRMQTGDQTVFLLQSTPNVLKKKTANGVVGLAYLNNFGKVIFDVPSGQIIFEVKDQDSAMATQSEPKRQSMLLR